MNEENIQNIINQLDNQNISEMKDLKTPKEIKDELPLTLEAGLTVINGRKELQDIIDKKDNRISIMVGPCSIIEKKTALDFAGELLELQEMVKDKYQIIMRTYFEKPRTKFGYPGLIDDPTMTGNNHINEGLYLAREIALEINKIGMPTVTEFLNTQTPQYISNLMTASAIGARNVGVTEFRKMASGLSMPVLLKNDVDGNIKTAINAVEVAKAANSFRGINQDAKACNISTKGNNYAITMLRGGPEGPNYQSYHVEKTYGLLQKASLPEVVAIDCSHKNSENPITGKSKDYQRQETVFKDAMQQIRNGNDGIRILMLESNIYEGGHDKMPKCIEDAKYGLSVTDECISMQDTKRIILEEYNKL